MPARAQLADRIHDRLAAARVQHGGGFVQNQAVRPHRDDARDGDALLLPARELVRGFFTIVVDAGHLHRVVDAGAHFVRGHAEVFKREGDVLLDNGGDDLVVRVLEHHARLLAHIVQAAFVARVDIFDKDGAGFRQKDGVEMFGERAFAAAVGAEHSDELALADRKAHAVHGVVRGLGVIAEAHLLCAEHRVHGRIPLYQSCCHSAVAPQGTTPPVAETGRPISSQAVRPSRRGQSVVFRMYSMTAGLRPSV